MVLLLRGVVLLGVVLRGVVLRGVVLRGVVLRGVVLLGLVLVVLGGGATPVSAAPSWGWPLAGSPPVTRPFAPGPTPYSPGHRGADLSARPGAAVRSAGPGVVAYAGRLAGRGVVVVVHGALRTTYEPVEASVSVGELVLRGQRIGALAAGHRGCPAEACLHWGLRRGLDYLDPLRLVGAGPVRLLPHEEGRAPGPAWGRGPEEAPGSPAAPPAPVAALGLRAEASLPEPDEGRPPSSGPSALSGAAPDRAAPDRAEVDRPAPDRRAPDRQAPDRAAPGRPAPDRPGPPVPLVLAAAAGGLLVRALLRPP